MLNMKVEGNMITFMEFDAKYAVGEEVITNAPGCVGHNYAHWKILGFAFDPAEGKYIYVGIRTNLDGVN